MAIYGRALREQREDERRAEEPCPCCGHKDSHFELKPTGWDLETGDPINDPDYVPGEFHCAHEGCDCKVKIEGRGRSRKTVAA